MKTATFGAHLRTARIKKKISMRELAVRLGLSAPYVSDVEHSRRAPFPAGDVYAALAAVLGGSEEDWNARGAQERVRMAVDGMSGEGLPEHVRVLVRDLLMHAQHISPEAVKKMRDMYTIPAV